MLVHDFDDDKGKIAKWFLCLAWCLKDKDINEDLLQNIIGDKLLMQRLGSAQW